MVLYGLTKNCGCDKSLKKGVFFRLSPTLSDGGKGKKKRRTVPFMQESWNGEVE